MGYPGDQQQPGGWGPQQPPYNPAEDQAKHGGSSPDGTQGESPYGSPSYGDSPYAPPQGGSQSGSPYAPPSQGGSPYDPSRGGFPYDPGGSAFEPPQGPSYDSFGSAPPYGSEPVNQYGGGPGSFGTGSAFGTEPPISHDGGPPPYGPGENDFESGSDKKPWLIGTAVVAGVVIIGGGTALALSSGSDDPAPRPAATTKAAAPPSSPNPSPTPSPTETGKGARLQSRSTDPVPLTLNEVFKARTFKAGGRTYTMTARRVDRKCANGTHGTTFRKTLTKAGCNQVLRATFNNGKLIGTIGILNLKTQAAADTGQTASKPKDAYIAPLPGTGTTKKIGQGLSLTTAEVDGHYLIVSWVQYPNGKRISKADYPAVTAFVQSTTLGSNLRPALNYRSMEGKPS